ncbi:MAG TPA: Smr/MutS family protein [Gemmatimonadales bacterium]|nr:Smr/MutS family protein [Gemmatimonadales bacterium]
MLASSEAGTPSPLPGDRLDDALETLEFARALETVAGFAAGPLGARRVLARRPTDDIAWIRRELAGVEELAVLFRRKTPVVVEPVPDAGSALARLRVEGSVLDGPELVRVRGLLRASRLNAAELRRVADEAPLAGALLVPVPDKALDRRLETALDDDGQLLDGASPALATARREVQAARARLIRKLETILRAAEGAGDAGVTVRGGRYVIPVRRDARQRPAGIVHDESASQGTLFLEPTDAIELGNALREAESAEERERLRVLRDLTDLLRPAHAELRSGAEMCVRMDDLVARARYAAAASGFRPETVLAPSALVVVDGRHPLLLAAGEAVVPFDLSLDRAERTLVVSGPNTGGKTVLLKAVGLLGALAQSGVVPPVGAGSQLPVFTRIFADIGDHQSLAANLSTFSAHLAALRHILTDADDATLVLLDEIGSGTDPAEGAALAAAALLSLTRRGATTLATTHLGALKTLPERDAAIVNASLQFDAETIRPTYRFEKGVPGRSYGLAIARRLGIDRAVLEEAEADVPRAARTLDALLADAERRARALEAAEVALTERTSESERLAARLSAELEAVAKRDDDLRRRERDAERRAREQARDHLLAARQLVEEALGAARTAVDESAAREARRRVEEGIAEGARALAASARDEGGPRAAAVAVGSRVRTAAAGVGEVTELRGDGRAVVMVRGIRLVLDPSQLEVLPDEAPRERDPESGRREHGAPPDAPMEIDLRGLTGDEAEAAALAAIDAAVLAERPYLRIIHGMGTGVVRARVQRVLQADARVRSHAFAPPNQGGTGATVAELKP